MPNVDSHGRPEYPAIPDLQPELDRKNADLTARLAQIEKQEADARAKFPPAPEPKTVKIK